MKKTTPTRSKFHSGNDLLKEYNFDYGKALPNRFAGKQKDRLIIALDPDLSKVFTTSESVNAVLRALVKTMPPTTPKTGRKSSFAETGE